jgi:hypothetical protein
VVPGPAGIGGAIPPREGRVRATSAFTRVFDALWRGGGEIARVGTYSGFQVGFGVNFR